MDSHLGQLMTQRINIAEVEYDARTMDKPIRRTYVSTDRHGKATSKQVSEHFGIGIERAKATLQVTTQRGTRSAILPLARRYKADRRMDEKRLHTKFATDTLWAKTKSLRSNVAAQIYSNKNGFKVLYPIERANGQRVGDTLGSFIADYGIPDHLTYDGALVQTGTNTRFMDLIRRNDIRYHVSAPRRPNENPAEAAIRDLKMKWYRLQHRKNIPTRLWDYGMTWLCEISNVTANYSRYSNGRTPLEIITGETPDISEYMDFGFYDWVIFRSNAGLGPAELGRWLGVSHRIGKMMSYWILPPSGIPISCVTVQRLTELEKDTTRWQEEMKRYDRGLAERYAATSADLSHSHKDIPPDRSIDIAGEDEEFQKEFARIIDDPGLKHEDEDYHAEYGKPDPYLNMELGLPRGPDDELAHARVKRRAVDEAGTPIGKPADNPMLDSRQYEVEFMDGSKETLTANIIAENLLAQVDEEGHRQLLFDEIIDHRTTKDAIPKAKGYHLTRNGLKRRIRTTRGWQLYVQWKDGSGTWVELKDLKDSYPVELAEYAVTHDLNNEPAFAWWIAHVLKKRNAIIAKVKSKYWARTHKYGIRVPKSIKEAIAIDKENGDTRWMDAVRLEMKNVRVAFNEYEGNIQDLIGFTEITGHLVFDVKLGENFRRKARYCADGHKTNAPTSVTYSSVVSRDSVRLLLTIAALNDLQILSADVQNAFLTAPNLEKCWMKAGPEFGPEEGKIFIVSKALYGLKSASASFRAFMAEKLDDLGFQSSMADPDVWMRPGMKPEGDEYYEYILMYVDDILVVSNEPQPIFKELKQHVTFKNDKVEEPSNYLGARLKLKSIEGRDCWTLTSVDYVNAAVKNVEEALKHKQWKFPSKVTTPMTSNYYPELDGTPELDADEVTFYQEMIGSLRWATEIGRVDILHEVSILSQYQASPRQGHMEQLLHIFAYLKKKPKTTLYFDYALPNIDYGLFRTKREDFMEHYRDAKEEKPDRMPKPRGKSVLTTAFVDASHANNKKTRRSHIGHIIFVNRAPILWYSKRTQTVETSTFSSEFIAMKTCIEAIVGFRYKLRMFGIPIHEDHATNVFCDNESVVNNTSKVESVLNKKHAALAYNYCRWSVAAGVASIAWIDGRENIADAMTKRLSETVREYLFGNWTY